MFKSPYSPFFTSGLLSAGPSRSSSPEPLPPPPFEGVEFFLQIHPRIWGPVQAMHRAALYERVPLFPLTRSRRVTVYAFLARQEAPFKTVYLISSALVPILIATI